MYTHTSVWMVREVRAAEASPRKPPFGDQTTACWTHLQLEPMRSCVHVQCICVYVYICIYTVDGTKNRPTCMTMRGPGPLRSQRRFVCRQSGWLNNFRGLSAIVPKRGAHDRVCRCPLGKRDDVGPRTVGNGASMRNVTAWRSASDTLATCLQSFAWRSVAGSSFEPDRPRQR